MTDATRSPDHPQRQGSAPRQGSALEVLRVFLRLGLTSFGGPVAHLGFFRTEFVERRRWLDDAAYADLVALCQFLPGPASSQVGLAIGLQRAGGWGALAAWAGFTLPSAVLLVAFALGVAQHEDLGTSGVLQGLKLVAVAVVAQAVWGMARTLCPDWPRRALALAVAAALLAWPGSGAGAQVAAMALCAAVGMLVMPGTSAGSASPMSFGVSRRAGAAAGAAFLTLLLALPVLSFLLAGIGSASVAVAVVEGVYRAGALVFGGGHVVLPLLQSAVVPSGAVSPDTFLAGYGAAQAVPGPLFSVAAFLGAVMPSPWGGAGGALVLLVVIFLPGMLLVVAALPYWELLRGNRRVRAAMSGVNAGVVGLLLAALVHPVGTSALHRPADFGVVAIAFGLLVSARWSPVVVVAFGVLAGWALAR